MVAESPDVPPREELIALIQALLADNAALKARVAELERRLGLNSSNGTVTLTECGSGAGMERG